MKKTTIITALSALFLTGVSIAVYMYASGLRIDKEGSITATGMIAVKSVPTGANVYLNGELATATDGNIQSIKPGKYNLKVTKNGFVTWEKEVEVFEQLVTDITALLVSKTPRLEPLTNSGAKAPVISPSLTKIAYFTKDGEKPGVWVYPLGGNLQVNLFKNSPAVVLEDTPKISYSNGESLEWSPDEKEILVTLVDPKSIESSKQAPNQPAQQQIQNHNPKLPTTQPANPTTQNLKRLYFIADIDTKTAEATTSAELTKQSWNKEIAEKRELFLSKFQLDEAILKIANDRATVWSPDEKKFLYQETKDGTITFKVYNLEKPLPVGEKTSYDVLTIKEGEPLPKIYWYTDSFHLILVYGNVETEKKGTVYLVRIDGSNKTELYNNTLYSNVAYATPSGDKIVILAGFKSDAQPDLYAIGLR